MLTLVTGSIVNIAAVLSFGWFIAWLLAWLHTTAGSLTVKTVGGSPVTFLVDDQVSALTLHLSLPDPRPDGGSDLAWWLCWGLPAAGLALTGALYVVHLLSLRESLSTTRAVRIRAVAGWRLPVLASSVLYLAVSAGLPGLLFSLNQLAVANAPAPAVGAVLEDLGFADEAFCRAGARKSVSTALDSVEARARLNLGVAQSEQAGACGTTYTVTATYDDAGATSVDRRRRDALVDDLVTRAAPRRGSTSPPARPPW